MKLAPLQVLLLGWDAPAPTPAATASAPALAAALAPHAQLTLLLPYLPEPLVLPLAGRATGLGNLSPTDLAALAGRAAAAGPAAWPAAPYLGATPPAGGTETSAYTTPAAPYLGATPTVAASGSAASAASQAPSESASAPADLAADQLLLNRDDFEADSEPAADEVAALAAATDAPEPELAPTHADAPRQPLRHPQVLEVALQALRTEPADEAGLNFRVIQYARFAIRLAADRDFAVIYAADWQAWLAGMEIRQQTGRPLVLHVHSLAADRATAADRGWIGELERLALRRADLVLTDTSTLAMRVLELHELPPQRVRRLGRAVTENPDQLADAILTALREVVPGR